MQGNLKRADVNCSDTTTVTDVIAPLHTARGQPLIRKWMPMETSVSMRAPGQSAEMDVMLSWGKRVTLPSDCGICEGVVAIPIRPVDATTRR